LSQYELSPRALRDLDEIIVYTMKISGAMQQPISRTPSWQPASGSPKLRVWDIVVPT
jgi:hypothetical protein